MKKLLTSFFFIIFILSTTAHEGGHGELVEAGKFGGITSPVVDIKDAGQASKAQVLYKSELVRNESGKLSLYLFDQKMNLLDLKLFDNEIEAKLEIKKKGQFKYFSSIKLIKKNNHYEGNLPKIEYRPFNIDFFIRQSSQKLFIGFANLD